MKETNYVNELAKFFYWGLIAFACFVGFLLFVGMLDSIF
jgi:hypothetical protein